MADPLPPIPEAAETSLMVVDHAPMDAGEHAALPAPEPPEKTSTAVVARPKIPSPPLVSSSSALTRIDGLASHLNRCMQTPAGVDSILLILCYSTRLSAALINSALHPSPRILSILLRLMPSSSSSSSTAVTTKNTPVPKGSILQVILLRLLPRLIPRLSDLAARLKTFSALTSDARTFTRLWSLLGLYLWARRLTSASTAPSSPVDSAIGWTQLVACTGLAVLENGAFLSHRKVLGWSAEKQAWAYRWSTRFWTVYVATELGKLAVERVRVNKKRAEEVAALAAAETALISRQTGHSNEKGDDDINIDDSIKDDDDDDAIDAARADAKLKEQQHWAWEDRWRGNLLRNLAWAPLTIHWGLERGLVNETVLSMLGCIPGIVQTRQLWKDTAEGA